MHTLTSLIRESMKYAAYAVTCGFTLHGSHENRPPEFASGIPTDALVFRKGDVIVFYTERGWRVAVKRDGKYDAPQDCDFYTKLHPALVAANTVHALLAKPQPLQEMTAAEVNEMVDRGIVG